MSLGVYKLDGTTLTCGVPQASVPVLFSVYLLPLGRIIRQHSIHFHCYADDAQINIKMQPNPTDTISTLNTCLEDLCSWMNNNFLQINSSKMETILIGNAKQLANAGYIGLSLDGQFIPLSSAILV